MAEPNFKNRTLFHGDNLDFLREINSNTVHLIATDPPFNKGRDFHATPDSLASGASFQDRWSWEKDVHEEWTDKITDDYPRLMEAIESARYAHSDGMGAFMCFMAVRLMEMWRVLRQDGSIYLHCDPTASHYLKAVMDAIFGHVNFRNEVIWQRTTNTGSSKARAHKLSNDTDSILYYAKSKNSIFNRQYKPYSDDYLRRFKYRDERGKYRWQCMSTYSEQKVKELREKNMLREKGKNPEYKQYLHELKGISLSNLWIDVFHINPMARERTGYPTQKPLALYERIVKVSSNPNDIVLDPFCGCATTLIAAERLGRQWAGIDIWDKAHDIVIDRLKKEGLAGPDRDTGGRLFTFGEITYTKTLPERTDNGDEAVAFPSSKGISART